MAELFEDWDPEKMERYFPKSRRVKALQKGKKFVELEGTEQKNFESWLRANYPAVLFTADFVGHAESLVSIAAMHRAKDFTTPDLMIFHPTRLYHGMFMEFKTTDFVLYKRDGTLRKNKHIEDQYETIMNLRDRGYWADFVPGMKRAKEIFTQYVNLGEVDPKFITANK